jgi:hypothetical protein
MSKNFVILAFYDLPCQTKPITILWGGHTFTNGASAVTECKAHTKNNEVRELFNVSNDFLMVFALCSSVVLHTSVVSYINHTFRRGLS